MSADRIVELHALATKLVELTREWPAEPEAPPPKLLTFEQTAEALAVGRTTVQELVDSGQLPVVAVTGRAVRVDVRDVEEYIRRKRSRR